MEAKAFHKRCCIVTSKQAECFIMESLLSYKPWQAVCWTSRAISPSHTHKHTLTKALPGFYKETCAADVGSALQGLTQGLD